MWIKQVEQRGGMYVRGLTVFKSVLDRVSIKEEKIDVES